MRKAVIRAANTWHFMYLIAGTFLFLAVGPALAMFINEPIFIFAVDNRKSTYDPMYRV